MCKTLLAIFLLCLVSVTTSTAEIPVPYDSLSLGHLRIDLSHETRFASDNSLDKTFRYRTSLIESILVEGGLRLADSGDRFPTVQYEGKLIYPVLSFVTLDASLTHASRISLGLSQTHLTGLLTLRTPFFESWEIFASVGWYERWNRLTSASPLPTFSGSFGEEHFLLLIGFRADILKDIRIRGWAGTFETFDIYNINNPLGELAVDYDGLAPVRLHLFGRYRMLLGFGRRDAILVGAGVSIPLSRLFNGTTGEADHAS